MLNSEIFKALAVDMRRGLLEAMIESDRTVSELTEIVPISQSAVSQHLAVLKKAELVRDRKVGRNRYYSVRADQLLLLDDWLDQFRGTWPAAMSALENHLENRKN
jgi:DNA-binding transcriptional ArsR family regulator